jgi:DNA polymerase-3 subunit alpha
MNAPGFIHLRVHSPYSLSEGAIRIKELVKLAKAQGMPAVAVTDTGNLFGAMEFALEARSGGVQPIVGCVFHVALAPLGVKDKPDQLVLLVQDDEGYRNLIRLVSRSFIATEGQGTPFLPLDALTGATAGLICLTGGPRGPLGRALRAGKSTDAEAALARLKALFPGRLYVELMRHQQAEEDRIEEALIDLAYAHDLPLVATNDCYFTTEAMHEAHDVLLCIADGRYVTEQDRRRLTPDYRLKTPDEMRELFADLPEAVENTVAIARRCSFLLKPIAPLLPRFLTESDRSEEDELRAQAREGLEKRLATSIFTPFMDAAECERVAAPYRERLEFELDVIIRMKFAGYFLIVADFIQWAKAQGIPVGPGRGSGAGSVAAWALTITELDPLRFGLLFERFLNPERVSMPDFDIDFCQDRRDEVIEYVRKKYGEDRVAQIITFGKLQARAVLKDVGRVLQMPYGQVDKIAKLVSNNPANPETLEQAITREPLFQQMMDNDETVKRLIDIARKLEGLYRHASTHAAGVVIGDRPLDQLIPLYRDPRSPMLVTQYNMKYVEQAGLVKFDFLGLKTLTVLQQAVEMIRAGGTPIDLETIPLDDAKTFETLSRAEAVGVFQVESAGMREALRGLKPDRIEDLIALVALYRPGPMENIPKYISVKDGKEAPDYLHPLLKDLLMETYGIIVYQEQVMQIAQILSGYSLGAADLLRRAMGKKIAAEMEAQRAIFAEGALKNGVDPDQAKIIFDQVEKFAGYGFNKSHAAAYALITYQTAYLKANYPVAFMAASMNLDIGNTDKLAGFRQELQRMGIALAAPDVNESDAAFKIEGAGAIRYALGAIKGVGFAAMQMLAAERAKLGKFRDVFDFARRLDAKVINKRQVERLAAAGALDSLLSNRTQAFSAAETIVRYAQSVQDDLARGQSSLFGGPGAAIDTPKLPVPAKNWTELEALKHEFEAIGFYLSAHPLDAVKTALGRLGVVFFADIPRRLREAASTRMQLAAVVIDRTERNTRNDTRMAHIACSDPTGTFEVTCFSEVLSVSRPLLESGSTVLMSVDVQQSGEDLRFLAQRIEPLEPAVAGVAAGLRLFVESPVAVQAVEAVLAQQPKGRGHLSLVVKTAPFEEVEIKLPGGWALSGAGRAALKAAPGVLAVQDF